jgi:hypothetical protein
MAMNKVVSITDNLGDTFHLTASVLREGLDNKEYDVQSVSKTQLRKVFAAKGKLIQVKVEYRLTGGELFTEHDVTYVAYVSQGILHVGCRTFGEADTRKIRRWVNSAKKAA